MIEIEDEILKINHVKKQKNKQGLSGKNQVYKKQKKLIKNEGNKNNIKKQDGQNNKEINVYYTENKENIINKQRKKMRQNSKHRPKKSLTFFKM